MRVNHHQRPNAIACKRMRDAHDARARSIVLMCLCVRCDDMTRSRSSSTSSSSHSNESSSTITTPYHRTHRPSMSVHWVLSARDDIFVNEWMNVRRTRGQPMRVHAVMRRVNTNQCTYVSWSCIVYSLLYYTICGGVCCIILYSCGYRWTEHRTWRLHGAARWFRCTYTRRGLSADWWCARVCACDCDCESEARLDDKHAYCAPSHCTGHREHLPLRMVINVSPAVTSPQNVYRSLSNAVTSLQ